MKHFVIWASNAFMAIKEKCSKEKKMFFFAAHFNKSTYRKETVENGHY